jgi:capsular polysaccharide biosynthesis protein
MYRGVPRLFCARDEQNTTVAPNINNNFFFAVALRLNAGHGLLILKVFLDHTQRRTTIGRTPLDERSVRR